MSCRSTCGIKESASLAAERGVNVAFLQADAHTWDYPEAAFDVVVEIFTQFSLPAERSKWAGMRRALKSGGLLILQGYTPKQLDYGTGGPKRLLTSIPARCWKESFLAFTS